MEGGEDGAFTTPRESRREMRRGIISVAHRESRIVTQFAIGSPGERTCAEPREAIE